MISYQTSEKNFFFTFSSGRYSPSWGRYRGRNLIDGHILPIVKRQKWMQMITPIYGMVPCTVRVVYPISFT